MLSDHQSRESLFSALEAYPLPVGVYVVRMVDGVEVIVNCNAEFARLFGYDSPEGMVGLSPVQLAISESDYTMFLLELRKANAIYHYTEVLRRKDGSAVLVELHARQDYDEQDRLIGRSGIVLAYSTFEQTFTDMSKFLHDFSITLSSFDLKLKILRDAFTPPSDPFGEFNKMPSMNEINAALEKPVDHLKNALTRLLTDVEGDERKLAALHPNDWVILTDAVEFLHDYKDIIDAPAHRHPAIRDTARRVIDIMSRMGKGLPNETSRGIRDRASEVERLVALYTLHLMIGTLIELDHQAKMLRGVLSGGARKQPAPAEVRMSDLIVAAQVQLQEFAANRGIIIRVHDKTHNTAVKVIRNDMQRAIENLLHNAIKYSWSKRESTPWVDIRGFLDDGYVVIEVENHGVGIAREEIESGAIYRLGVRGKQSNDRSRTGTGIGLFDAKTVAQQCGGDLTLRSTPARLKGDPDDLEQPFITVARLQIPIPKGFD